MALAHHRAVQMQQRTVDRAFHPDRIENHPGDRLECLVGDDARRVGVGRDRVDEAPAEFVGRFEGGAKRRPGAAKRVGDLVFEMVIATSDHRHISRHPAEGVGLVHESGGQDALQEITSSIATARGSRNIRAHSSRRQEC
jgi:hypothetical protein